MTSRPMARFFSGPIRLHSLALLRALPTGVVGMSAAMPGSVETSLILPSYDGRTKVRGGISMRSSVETALDDIVSRVDDHRAPGGAEVRNNDGLPCVAAEPVLPAPEVCSGCVPLPLRYQGGGQGHPRRA